VVATVLLGLKDPQVASELPGVQLQVTPELVGSLVIDAKRFTLLPASREAGGGVVSVTVGLEVDVLLELLHASSAATTLRHIPRRINLWTGLWAMALKNHE
jgi:hypothetical protein